ncbi:hypothetical protein [Chitinophaga flava]|uniref:Uncharacterized protein n=1 Tax=Chitinophaga flava TaxID=2259036 RepID=A0A365XW98_9BACT|nr:hypothetical protein [Chitinophaga flava]RBL90613.1 hypothetical protein DF182_29605 [Chitinophaga flava]
MQQKNVPLTTADTQLLQQLDTLDPQAVNSHENTYRKMICSGYLIRMELTTDQLLRYLFDDGQAVVVCPLLPPQLVQEESSQSLIAEGLSYQPVVLEIITHSHKPDLLVEARYNNYPAQLQHQTILTANLSRLRKETGLVALVFAVVLCALLITGYTGSFNTSVILMGWAPPLAIAGIGLIMMMKKYRSSLKKAIHQTTVSGIVTEKFSNGKLSWYRIGELLFESNDSTLAVPGQPLQVVFTTNSCSSQEAVFHATKDSSRF